MSSSIKNTAVVVASNGLNLRAGPGRTFNVMEVLKDGTECTVLPLPEGVSVPGWGAVSAGGKTGWVDLQYVKMLEE